MLTDAKIRKLKAEDKPYKVADSNGLHLFVTPSGTKSWRYRYRFGGKEKLLSLGSYPDIGLAEARTGRDDARRMLKQGKDPSAAKKEQLRLADLDNANTFETIAREWHALQAPAWADKHSQDVLHSLERDIFPEIGDVPIRDLNARSVLQVLRPIEKRGAAETARRIRQRMSAVFVYAIAQEICDYDPAAQVQKAMAPVKKGRQPALTTLDAVREIISRVDRTPAHPVTKLAHRLLALTVVRPGTLVGTPWTEFEDLSDYLWTIPSERMKLRLHLKDDSARDHLVPLSSQALETIEAIRVFTGRGPLVFPNTRHAHKIMSENAIGYLLNRAGYHHRHVPHGWRAAFSTIMNEQFPDKRPMIDVALAHVPKDKVEGAYNRALYLEQRKVIMQDWADLVMADQLPLAEVTRLPRKVLK